MTSQIRKHHAARKVDKLIAQHAQSLRGVRHPFWQLIHVIRDRTSLLSPGRATDYATCPADTERIIQTCKRLSCFRSKWYQIPETWAPPDASRFVQMRSLVQHLFDRYTVPDFMASVWWPEYADEWGISLYLHLATGLSIRRFSGLHPFRVSKTMAALFMEAPDDLRPHAAIRWSQVLALGGDARLARILISRTLLSRPTSDEPFWETVIRFLILNQPISSDETMEIVHFILQQRFEPAEKVWGIGSGDCPVQPEFTLRGRSLKTLRRHMVHWRSELIEKGMMPPPDINILDFPWQRSCIGAFCCKQDNAIWTIEELLTPRQLHNEGQNMNHCVAEYISVCARRKTTIWSMKVQTGRCRQRQLTIEVSPHSKVIQQASGKNNCKPSKIVREMLNLWAAQEGLRYQEQI